MKLYTEEQVRKAMQDAIHSTSKYSHITSNDYNIIIGKLTPIELPSDEEIEEAFTHKTLMQTTIYQGEMQGAKWVLNKIKNQQ